jgi:hypothetical protein
MHLSPTFIGGARLGNELPTWMLLTLSVIVAALTFIAEPLRSASSQRPAAEGAAECVRL